MMNNIILRREALKLGLKRYFTGKSCKQGHIAERFTKCGVCLACHRISVDEYAEHNKEKIATRLKKWRLKNPNYFNDWYDSHKEQHQQYTKTWKKNNPEKLALLVDKRRDLLKQFTPKWYENEKELVKQLFLKRDELSVLLGVELTVDHVIPIQGDNVCGLHCWSNLQLLERKLNGKKKNLYETDW